ncbi:hypothetical protein BDV27DRAFT_132577 [Aspergillus caelatus]|uniref:Uncharacterized protein n=1 Tax=Aspergillus caelatus TaxID=61420 RepID=A0A5N6ZWT6_9EURO|nr:uncharacterized protein BDV27DRAFT_132577 [Aspergillus caelatus]KAE8361723.1 hypothetical protein BDV27DRAFT_132577 [Aspergillus caelatus]
MRYSSHQSYLRELPERSPTLLQKTKGLMYSKLLHAAVRGRIPSLYRQQQKCDPSGNCSTTCNIADQDCWIHRSFNVCRPSYYKEMEKVPWRVTCDHPVPTAILLMRGLST